MRFEWDDSKAKSNITKHGVSFEEASTVFGDPLSLTVADPKHPYEEKRYVIIGLTSDLRTVVVVHTERGESIRIITARLATKRERKDYEKGIK